jgi:predicted dinucleotide-binding enzyme
MRIGIIGAGRVGVALGLRWSEVGHQVVFGVRDPTDPRHAGREVADVTTASTGADAVLIALPWHAVEAVTTGLPLGDAVVIDATNPLAGTAVGSVDPGPAGAELIAGWTGSHRVVKAFNTTGSGNMVDPTYPTGTPTMFYAGDDAGACELVAGLATELGFDAVHAGGLDAAIDLEHLARLWIRLAHVLGNGPDIAVSLIRR